MGSDNSKHLDELWDFESNSLSNAVTTLSPAESMVQHESLRLDLLLILQPQTNMN